MRTMSRLLALVALLACMCGGCVPSRALDQGQGDQLMPAGSEKAGEVLEVVAGAVVRVDVTLYMPSGTHTNRGSGFVASEDGLVITSAALVASNQTTDAGLDEIANARMVEVTVRPGTDGASAQSAEVVRENSDLGLALLQMKALDADCLTMAGGVDDGATVFACGAGSLLGQVSVRAGRMQQTSDATGRELIELGLEPDPGSSGGPLVDEDGRVIGMLVASEGAKQTAVASATINGWLASRADDDSATPAPGQAVRDLLDQASLAHDDAADGIFAVPFDNDVRVYVHQSVTYLHVFVPLGKHDAENGLRALAFNYYDPVGKLSLHTQGGEDRLTWEAQVPMSVASADYLKLLTQVGANQAVRWRGFLEGNEPEDWYDQYPGGDKSALTDRLVQVIKATGADDYEAEGESFKVKRGDVTVWLTVFRGMVWIHCYIGGMPGEGQPEQLVNAEDFLRRNWRDPLGRLSVDKHNDLGWEMQAPVELLTPELVTKALADGELQVEKVWSKYGHVPFNEETDD